MKNKIKEFIKKDSFYISLIIDVFILLTLFIAKFYLVTRLKSLTLILCLCITYLSYYVSSWLFYDK
ncbi:MAG: hypothetical protein ACI4OT_00255 [Bacilli bacterium]